jgi:hypothetical protein
MLQTNIDVQSGTDQELVEAVATLHQTTLADDQLSCQVCNESINEGDEVICHLQSPADQNRYDIKQTRCTDHDDLTELLTLGVDELVIDGRIGCCSDQATQQSWPVLLVPQLRLVSAASTTTARETTAQPEYNDDPAESLTVDIPQPTKNHHWGKEQIADDSEPQETTLKRWEQPPTATTEDDR